MAIVVDEPIINDPFAEPRRHYCSAADEAQLVEDRRPSPHQLESVLAIDPAVVEGR